MKPGHKFWCGISTVALALAFQPMANANILVDDAKCKQYGCAVVHDGQNLIIYDLYDASTNKLVPVGSPLIPRTSAFGGLNRTGSLNKNTTPDSDQGLMMGVTEDGTTVSQSVIDDNDGFLDAGDVFLNAFALSPSTDVLLDGRGSQYSHSFFITSTKTRLSLRAKSSISSSTNDFANTVALGDIGLTLNISRQGNDDGFSYGGGKGNNALKPKINNAVDDLGDLASGYTNIVEFRTNNGQGNKKKNTLEQSLVRLDFLYTMPKYDLSMGIGSLNIDMFFEIYRER